MRILFVTPFVPYPPVGGSSIVTFNFLRHLAHHHDVTLTYPAARDGDDADTAGHLAERLPLRVVPGPALSDQSPPAAGGDRRRPSAGALPPFAAHLRDVLAHDGFDVIHFERLAAASQRPLLGRLGAPAVALAHDAEFWVQEQCWRSRFRVPHSALGRAARLVGARRAYFALKARRLRRREVSLLRGFDQVITLSFNDEAVFRRCGLTDLTTVAPGVDLRPPVPIAGTQAEYTLLFVGEYRYFPNFAAALYLLDRVLPLIADLPVKIVLAGAGASPELRRRHDGKRVVVAGFVEDLDILLAAADIFVVPLKMGSGVKIKTLTALSCGLPVVASPHGCQGLEVVDGTHVLVARRPEEFAAAVRELAGNPFLRRRLGTAGRRLVADRYSIEAAGRRLETAYQCIGGSGRRRAAAATPDPSAGPRLSSPAGHP